MSNGLRRVMGEFGSFSMDVNSPAVYRYFLQNWGWTVCNMLSPRNPGSNRVQGSVPSWNIRLLV